MRQIVVSLSSLPTPVVPNFRLKYQYRDNLKFTGFHILEEMNYFSRFPKLLLVELQALQATSLFREEGILYNSLTFYLKNKTKNSN